jgi:hypothetical protein
LIAIELVVVIDDCADEEFDSGFGNQEGVCREYA